MAALDLIAAAFAGSAGAKVAAVGAVSGEGACEACLLVLLRVCTVFTAGRSCPLPDQGDRVRAGVLFHSLGGPSDRGRGSCYDPTREGVDFIVNL